MTPVFAALSVGSLHAGGVVDLSLATYLVRVLAYVVAFGCLGVAAYWVIGALAAGRSALATRGGDERES